MIAVGIIYILFMLNKYNTSFMYTQVALLIILLQDQWKKTKEANTKKVKEPTKNPKEAHD